MGYKLRSRGGHIVGQGRAHNGPRPYFLRAEFDKPPVKGIAAGVGLVATHKVVLPRPPGDLVFPRPRVLSGAAHDADPEAEVALAFKEPPVPADRDILLYGLGG